MAEGVFSMKIGVVSDTHSKSLPEQMVRDFKDVDLILHAGDFCEREQYDRLSKINKVEGVCGNMDGPGIGAFLPAKKIITCGRYRIGLTHGEGAPKTLFEKIRTAFAGEKIDCVVFGHSHHPFNETIGGVLYFNPGSATDEIFAPYRSYGILELTDQGIQGRVVEVKNAR